MNAWWTGLAARIDVLSLRERVFLFLALLAVFIALADVAWLTPAQQRYRTLTQQFATENQELDRLRVELRGLTDAPSPAKALLDRSTQVQADLLEVDAAIATMTSRHQAGVALSDALVHFLRRQPGLTLVRTATLSPSVSPTSPPLQGNTSAASGAGVARQGLELTVTGSYAQLAQYVQTLETTMPDLRWGPLQMDARRQPVELRMQVYLLEAQP